MPFDARYLTSTSEGHYPDTGGPDGRWYLAKPLPNPFIMGRIREAWMVLMGRAEIIVWPSGKEGA